MSAPKIQPWTKDETAAFVAACEDDPYGDLWLTQLGCGLRPLEALALHVVDVDLEQARVRIRHSLTWSRGGRWSVVPTKGRDDLRVPVPQLAVQALRRRLDRREKWRQWDGWQEHGLVFTTRAGTPLRGTSIGKPLTKLCTRAGVPRVTPHGLRHQTASALLAHGVPIAMVQHILRHRNQRLTTDLYGHLADDLRSEWVATLDGFMSADR